MILVCGIPTETPLAMVGEELDDLGVPWVLFNQRAFSDADFDFEVDSRHLTGRLRAQGVDARLEDVAGVYLRLMDDRMLPELRGESAESEVRRRCRELHDALWRWSDLTSARVVNRPQSMTSNGAKPYQAQLIQTAGFRVPETLVTNDPSLVREFLRQHGRVIFKSASGARSIVHELDVAALARLDRIRWCPVQFQAFVPGVDVRVHVVGETVYATEVRSEATDYRYAGAGGEGRPAQLRAIALDDDVAERCVALSRDMGLAFSGIDFRLAHEEPPVCFEVNPCPAFAYFERHTGQRIAQAVARLLAGAA